jgi:hypothetical protein
MDMSVIEKNNRIRFLQEDIARRNRDNKKYKEELTKLKNELIMHYHDLLTVGIDTR